MVDADKVLCPNATDLVGGDSENDNSVSHSPLVTVIVPCFNEATTVDQQLRRIVAAQYDKQIIVVDDGSTDGTSYVLRKWRRLPQIVIVTHYNNCGKGAAIRSGLKAAKGRFVIVQDADLETNPNDYPSLIEPLRRGEAEAVFGIRRPTDRRGLLPIGATVSRLGVTLLDLAVRLIYGRRIVDEACCYKALRTSTLKEMALCCNGFDFCPEVVAKACRSGLTIHQVHVDYVPRSRRQGKKLRAYHGISALAALWQFRNWNASESRDFSGDRCRRAEVAEQVVALHVPS